MKEGVMDNFQSFLAGNCITWLWIRFTPQRSEMSFVTKEQLQVNHESPDWEVSGHRRGGRDGGCRWFLQGALQRRDGEKGGGTWRNTWQGRGLGQDERWGKVWDTEAATHLILMALPPTWVHLETLGGGGVGWLVSGDKSSKSPTGRMAKTTFSVVDPSSELLLMPPPLLSEGLTEPHNHNSFF